MTKGQFWFAVIMGFLSLPAVIAKVIRLAEINVANAWLFVAAFCGICLFLWLVCRDAKKELDDRG